YSAWSPNPAEDPDGHLLGADNGPAPEILNDVLTPENYPEQIALALPAKSSLENFAELAGQCDVSSVPNSGHARFARRDSALGLTGKHGYTAETWHHDNRWVNYEVTMIAGGVTAVYLDGDCWPD